MSLGFVSYWFPELKQKIVEKRRAARVLERQALIDASRAALGSGVLAAYAVGSIARKRDMVRLVSRESGSPISLVRQVLMSMRDDY